MMRADPRAYLTIEKAIHDRIAKTWQPIAIKYFVRIKAALKDNDFDGARDIAKSISLRELGTKNKEYIKYMFYSSAVFGAGQARGQTDKGLFFENGTYEKRLETITKNFIMGMEYNATLQTYKAAIRDIIKAEKRFNNPDTVQKADEKRYVDEFVTFAEQGLGTAQMISSLHTSRLSSWGFLAEGDLLGYKSFILTAVLDDRTSAFCEEIDGTEFDLEPARELIDAVLSAETPDDVKTIQAWPKQDRASLAEFADMAADELSARGLSVPPFHPWCRTMMQPVPFTEADLPDFNPDIYDNASDQAIVGEEVLPFIDSTAASFDELGINFTAEQVDNWNSVVGIDPTLVLAYLADTTLDYFQKGNLKTAITADIKTTKLGDINVNIEGALAGAESVVAVNKVFDPIANVMYENYMEFAKASPTEAAKFFIKHQAGTGVVATTMGTAQIVASAGGELGAFSYAKFGYVPSSDAWNNISTQIANDLTENGRLRAVLGGISPADLATVKAVLSSTDPKALWVLTDLPIQFGGKQVAETLLQGKAFTALFNLDDPQAMAKYKAYFK